MVPAQQGLGGRDLQAERVDLGLEVQLELPEFQRAAQIVHQHGLLTRVKAHLEFVMEKVPAAIELGAAHGQGCMAQQVAARAVLGEHRDADGAAQVRMVDVELERLGKGLQHMAGGNAAVFRATAHAQRKLAGRDPAGGFCRASTGGQAARGVAQQAIADIAAKGIVEQAKIVQRDIEQAKGLTAARSLLHLLIQDGIKAGAREQTSQFVAHGHGTDLTLQILQFAAQS